MDDVTWAALTLTLSGLGAGYSWWAFRHRGAGPGLRGVALTLLPLAAWLTGSAQMFSEIAVSVTTWAGNLVLSPAVWAGIAVVGLAGLLHLISRVIDTRRTLPPGGTAPVTATARPAGKSSKKTQTPAPVDAEFADIEELLRRKGIQ